MGISGIIVVDKEQNMTSHDVVGRIRKILGLRKVGHTGTLDPMATGVLPVCVGRATRIMEYLDMDFKTYRCSMLLGKKTDSGDVWGTELCSVTEQRVNQITENHIRKAFESFSGRIRQRPPIYSAVRVGGKRLYEYAREGRDVEIPSRNVYIKELVIENMNLGKGYESSVTFSVTCSKGTYIRSICDDAGDALGVYAAMSALQRTACGRAEIEHALGLDELEHIWQTRDTVSQTCSAVSQPRDMDGIPETLRMPGILRIPDMLKNFGELNLNEKDVGKFLNGAAVPVKRCELLREPAYAGKEFVVPVRNEFYRAYSVNGILRGKMSFLGVAFMDEGGGQIKADKVFVAH